MFSIVVVYVLYLYVVVIDIGYTVKCSSLMYVYLCYIGVLYISYTSICCVKSGDVYIYNIYRGLLVLANI